MSYLIAIDSGHGMETAGKRTPVIPEAWFGKKKGESIREKEFNKPTAEYLIKALERCGFKTINVSPGTTDISLNNRYTVANNAKADAFVSKHYNAFKGIWGKANGIETIISQFADDNTKRLARCIQGELVKAHGRIDRGVKTDIAQSGINIAVLRNAKMPAILTESGFMDNLEEAETMLNPKFQKADAEATCRGICTYFNVKYISEIPYQTITANSFKDDILWLQKKLNIALKGIYGINEDGNYETKTRIAVLLFWESKGWGTHMRDDGTKVGKSTIEALNKI